MVGKDDKMFLRCSTEQKILWEDAAKIDRRTLADWIRITLDDAAEKLVQSAEKKSK